MARDFSERLFRVERPARYTGGELNSSGKKPDAFRRMALVFPDTYEIGMSHVGMRILYHCVNDAEGLCCERCFHPWVDMEREMRSAGDVLTTLESGSPLRDFPLVGFSLPYELLYCNVLNVLDLARIPLRCSERSEDDPIVVAGGPCAFNPEPMAPFLDLVFLGDGESVIRELCRIAGTPERSRESKIAEMEGLNGIYRPSSLEVEYDREGRIIRKRYRRAGHGPAGSEDEPEAQRPQKPVIRKSWTRNLDAAYFPCRPVVPNTAIVHDRANLEIHRGCVHGCRFCQAGYIYRPLRVRKTEHLVQMAEEIACSTGYEELGLVALNSVDHPSILDIMDQLNDSLGQRRIALGMPSLRMDAISLVLARKLGKTKKTNVTLAPEAGSQRLRDSINKNLSEEQILASVDAFLEAGWRDMKLYFMIGLPGETDDDVLAIVDLVHEILARGSRGRGRRSKRDGQGKKERHRGRPFKVTVNVSSFVAKSHTPYQWAAMTPVEILRKRMGLLVKGLSGNRRVSLKWRDFDQGLVEGLLARGDRRLAPVLLDVWKNGGVLESWSDRFELERWEEALERHGLTFDEYLYRERPVDEILPWDHLGCGVDTSYLASEWLKSREGRTTEGCLGGRCSACGFQDDCPTLDLTRKGRSAACGTSGDRREPAGGNGAKER